MFVFYVLQTACFALYSEHGNLAAAHTFIAMICKHFLYAICVYELIYCLNV